MFSIAVGMSKSVFEPEALSVSGGEFDALVEGVVEEEFAKCAFASSARS
jgi:hypothetical protein